MWPDSLFAVPRGSFGIPVLPPSGEPDASPTKTVSVSCEWLPYIRGALQQLLLQSTWNTSDPAVLLIAQARAANLIALFDECSGSPYPFACPFPFAGGENGWYCKDYGSDFSPSCLSNWAGGGWVNVSFTYTPSLPAQYSWASCHKQFTSCTITNVTMTYDLIKGSFDHGGGVQNGIFIYSSGVVVASQLVDCTTDPDGTNKTISWTGSVTADEIELRIKTEDSVVGLATGHALIKDVEARGSGVPMC